jgi:hypothetical protein
MPHCIGHADDVEIYVAKDSTLQAFVNESSQTETTPYVCSQVDLVLSPAATFTTRSANPPVAPNSWSEVHLLRSSFCPHLSAKETLRKLETLKNTQ